MPPTQTRIVGSGFTVFQWHGKAVAFLDEVHDSGQAPIRQYEAVTPLGDYYPREFALPRVKSEGQLQFIIREMWNQPAWWALSLYSGTYNILDVYNITASTPVPISCSTIIKKPYNQAVSSNANRGWTYQNVNLITIDDREVVQIGALTMPRTITAVYSNKVYFPATGITTPTQVAPALSVNNNQAGGTGDKQFANT